MLRFTVILLALVAASCSAIFDPSLTLAQGLPSANQVYAGPTSGQPTAPTFRSLATADIPSGTITNSNIANMAAGTVKANPTTGSAAPIDWAIAASGNVEGTGVNGLDGTQFFIFQAPTTPSTP